MSDKNKASTMQTRTLYSVSPFAFSSESSTFTCCHDLVQTFHDISRPFIGECRSNRNSLSRTFRMAYDWLKEKKGDKKADREYLKILHLAASESESGVDGALALLFDFDADIDAETVKGLVAAGVNLPAPRDVTIDEVDLTAYDQLLLPGVTR